MYKAKADKNQKDIVSALRKAGASVIHLHTVGQGCPDLLVGIRGETYLLELKTKDGKLTKAQNKLFNTWNGKPISVVRTIHESLTAIGALSD